MPENTTAITREQVAHLGRLARLSLTDDELDRYSAQLADIVAAVARVTEVATPDVPATSHPMPLENVFREDVPRPTRLSRNTGTAGRMTPNPTPASSDAPIHGAPVPIPTRRSGGSSENVLAIVYADLGLEPIPAPPPERL